MMYEDEIEGLNEWFRDEERRLDTGFSDGEYFVSESDIEDLCDFLREQNPDLVGIPCMIGTSGIWFNRDDLSKATYL